MFGLLNLVLRGGFRLVLSTSIATAALSLLLCFSSGAVPAYSLPVPGSLYTLALTMPTHLTTAQQQQAPQAACDRAAAAAAP